MSKKLLKGTYPVHDGEPGIGRKAYAVLPCILACLLLIGSLLPVPLHAADPTGTQQAAVAADVAAGISTTTIINNAMAGGMTLSQAVQAMIMAGADPGTVTYQAITGGFAGADVVAGAADGVEARGLSEAAFQTQINTIYAQALLAGATAPQATTGLTNAGINQTVIANAIASQQTFGYSSPGGGTTGGGTGSGSGVGGALGSGGAPIGGAGFGSPTGNGSQQGSPSKP